MAIVLRPFMRDDFARLIEWVASGGPEFLVQWAGAEFDYPLDEAQLETHLASGQGPGAKRQIYAAVDESGEVVGHAELSRIDRRNRSASAARLLVGESSHRGQGIGAQIVTALLDIAFGELELHRLDLYVLDFNLAAIRLYESLGFKTEGHFVEARRVGTKFWNVYYMAMLEDAWRARGR
jgi:RimJ/RimL family protein N-acetyltransferase